MGYIGVKGGRDAILNAEKLVEYYRSKGGSTPLEIKQIIDQMRLSVDRVMSEGSLYDEAVSAIALKQAEGDVLEASYLVRAFRSTLPRVAYSSAAAADEMFVLRRISSAFQDIPWGQVLGPSRDYGLRLINFKLKNETGELDEPPMAKSEEDPFVPVTKVIEYLRREGLLETPELSEKKPYDITRQAVRFPMERSGRLQRLTRGEEGAVVAFGYASMRGWGAVHPTLAEVRVGRMPVKVKHPYWDKDVTIGRVMATECDAVCSFKKREVVADGEKTESYTFSLGYGLVFGHNDKKAISMAILDRALSEEVSKSPVQDQEFVLYHIDGMESQGFISHLKLPHYVTFQSAMDRIRSIKKRAAEKGGADE